MMDATSVSSDVDGMVPSSDLESLETLSPYGRFSGPFWWVIEVYTVCIALCNTCKV